MIIRYGLQENLRLRQRLLEELLFLERSYLHQAVLEALARGMQVRYVYTLSIEEREVAVSLCVPSLFMLIIINRPKDTSFSRNFAHFPSGIVLDIVMFKY